MNNFVRRGAVRVMLALVLLVSPVLFPILLLWSERRLRWDDLLELYAWVCGRLVRGNL